VGPGRLVQEPQLRQEHGRGCRQDSARHHAPELELLRRQLLQDYSEASGAEWRQC